MIVDAFMLRDELHLLEARLVEYGDLVDRFVIVEGELQFGDGSPKRLWFDEHRDRFAEWHDRIVHVAVRADEYPDGDGWARERYQRHQITRGLDGVPADATVMIGDVDEFPDRSHVANGARGACLTRHMVYAPNLEHPIRWATTAIVDAADAADPQRVRDTRHGMPLLAGGFHFSWHPGCEPISAKVAASSHVEYAHLAADDAKAARRTHWDGTRLEVVDIDHTWPRWFRESCPEGWLA